MSGGIRMTLPQFTFKKYLGSVMIDADDDPSNILVTIKNFVESVLSKINDPDTIALFIITEFNYDNISAETRVWFNKFKNTICFVSTQRDSKMGKTYKIAIEAFSVPRIAAQLDIEVLSQYGFKVFHEEGNIETLLKIIRNIIKIKEIEELIEKQEEEAESTKAPRASIGILGGSANENKPVHNNLTYCVRAVANKCTKGACVKKRGVSLLESLEESGLLVLGNGSTYVCILKEEGKCLYKAYWIDGESLISECINDLSKIKKILEKYSVVREDIAVPIYV